MFPRGGSALNYSEYLVVYFFYISIFTMYVIVENDEHGSGPATRIAKDHIQVYVCHQTKMKWFQLVTQLWSIVNAIHKITRFEYR